MEPDAERRLECGYGYVLELENQTGDKTQLAGSRDEYGLLVRQRAFADAYVSDPERNAAAAYRSAGYAARGNSSEVRAVNLLRHGKVAAYIAMRESKARAIADSRYDINQDNVLAELAGIVYSDPADLYDENGDVLPIHKMPERARRAIASIEHTRDGALKIKLWSKVQGADMLAKHLNLYEQHQKAAVPVNDNPFTREELIAELERRGLPTQIFGDDDD